MMAVADHVCVPKSSGDVGAAFASVLGVDGSCAWRFMSGLSSFGCNGLGCEGRTDFERNKGIRWMPWHQEAMKDVARCEKPRGAASRR